VDLSRSDDPMLGNDEPARLHWAHRDEIAYVGIKLARGTPNMVSA